MGNDPEFALQDAKVGQAATLTQILKTPDDSPKCCIGEVDLEFPQHLHYKFKTLSPCPKSLNPKMEWLSEFQEEIGTKSGSIRNDKYHGSDKPAPHLYKQETYVTHYRNL